MRLLFSLYSPTFVSVPSRGYLYLNPPAHTLRFFYLPKGVCVSKLFSTKKTNSQKQKIPSTFDFIACAAKSVNFLLFSNCIIPFAEVVLYSAYISKYVEKPHIFHPYHACVPLERLSCKIYFSQLSSPPVF